MRFLIDGSICVVLLVGRFLIIKSGRVRFVVIIDRYVFCASLDIRSNCHFEKVGTIVKI